MHDEQNLENHNAMLLAAGIAMIAFGAGILVAHPDLRRTAMTVLGTLVPDGKAGMDGGLSGLLPDFERYMRIKAM